MATLQQAREFVESHGWKRVFCTTIRNFHGYNLENTDKSLYEMPMGQFIQEFLDEKEFYTFDSCQYYPLNQIDKLIIGSGLVELFKEYCQEHNISSDFE